MNTRLGLIGIAALGGAIGTAARYVLTLVIQERAGAGFPIATLLVNVSNDAWFGKSFAAEQHLQSSQMRAIETGRPVVRSTNTGATAAIAPDGRVASRLPWFTHGILTTEVTPMQGMTPYARVGNTPAVLLALALLGWAWRRGRRP